MNDTREQLVEVRDILRQKLELMQEFACLAELLQSALKSREMDKFQEVIERRQRIIEKVNGLDRKLSHTEKINPGNLFTLSDDAVPGDITGEIRELIGELRQCLVRVREIDQKTKADLERDYHDLVRNLDALRTAKQARNMYRKKARQVEGYFVDKKR
ncbi:flagellar export chaperone FlgN [Desulfallas sp. Bu1-1]|uniref:flagellar export chaperone FlgN n=1 Tax=Desulfallas sp. Bu1-1 TaxID=2787620 RepID=UPI00189CB9E4|nr:flagellar export chaperone FlgN [Desulfallas sp. Bu1-1]MBF7081969.1 flagellar export chaperone FlgN [Desulfallas sp. Bu1-1]